MKKFLNLIIVTILAVCLCGCGKGDEKVERYLEDRYGCDFTFVKNGPVIADINEDSYIYRDENSQEVIIARNPQIDGEVGGVLCYYDNYGSSLFDEHTATVCTEIYTAALNKAYKEKLLPETAIKIFVDTKETYSFLDHIRSTRSFGYEAGFNNDCSAYNITSKGNVNIYINKDLDDICKTNFINLVLNYSRYDRAITSDGEYRVYVVDDDYLNEIAEYKEEKQKPSFSFNINLNTYPYVSYTSWEYNEEEYAGLGPYPCTEITDDLD